MTLDDLVSLDGGLFRRVILHGGTALASWSLSQDPLTYTRLLAESVNCSAVVGSSTLSVSGDVLRCLKRLPVEHVVEKARLLSAPRLFSNVLAKLTNFFIFYFLLFNFLPPGQKTYTICPLQKLFFAPTKIPSLQMCLDIRAYYLLQR